MRLDVALTRSVDGHGQMASMMSDEEIPALAASLFASPGPEAEAAVLAWLANLDGQEASDLVARASAGHSPSARAIANAADIVTVLALEARAVKPRAGLRDRILASIGAGPNVRPAGTSPATVPPDPAARRSPAEALSGIHERLEDDRVRLARIAETRAAGVRGGDAAAHASDAELTLLLDRIAALVDPGALFVSIVRGPETIHRVHRGFPPAFGKLIDVVPRHTSFCTHCVSADAPLVVHDARSEAFFRPGTVVQIVGARTYVGVPLRVRGVGVGALCSIGFERPRTIDATEVALFALFARHAEAVVAGDDAARADVFADGLYTTTFFRELLERLIARRRAEAGNLEADKAGGMRSVLEPFVAVVPAEARATVPPEAVATQLSPSEIGVLIGAEHAATGTAFVRLSADVTSAADWLRRARH